MSDYATVVARCVDGLLGEGRWSAAELSHLTIRDLPAGPAKSELMQRRFALGLSMCPNSRVLVNTPRGH